MDRHISIDSSHMIRLGSREAADLRTRPYQHRLMLDGASGRKISEPLLDGLSDIDLVRERLPPRPVRERIDEAPRSDLIEATARAFGFARTGGTVFSRLNSAVDRLLGSGKIGEKLGSLVVTE